MTRETKLLIVTAVFISGICSSLLLSSKITTLFGLTFTVGAFGYAITFPCTDVLGECVGKKSAQRLVWLGFLSYVIVLGFTAVALASPPAPFWAENADSYANTLGLVPRIVLGSVLAYLIAQRHDVWAFHFWRRVTNEKFLWLRNNLSTLTSQLIDTLVFVVIAFAGAVPNEALIPMIAGQYLIKVGVAAVDTPLVYLGVKWLGYDN